jgi:HSP20 family protein
LDASTLTISGLRKKPDIFYQSDDIQIKVSECFWGRFTRSVVLPENLDFDSVKASMENSLLVVRIAKLQFSSKKIKIEHLDD